MSDIKQVRRKSRLHVSVNLLLEYGRHVARLHRRRRRLFPFRKQAMPFLTVDAIIGNQTCHNQ